MRCMKVVLPDPAIPMHTTATGGFDIEASEAEAEVEAMVVRCLSGALGKMVRIVCVAKKISKD